MMNDPTNKAIPAKTENMIVTNPRFLLTSSENSFAIATPDSASTLSGTAALRRLVSSVWLTPEVAATLIWSYAPGLPNTRCAVAVSK